MDNNNGYRSHARGLELGRCKAALLERHPRQRMNEKRVLCNSGLNQ